MFIKQKGIAGFLTSAAFLAGCGGDSIEAPTPQISTIFTSSSDGGQGGFSDYSVSTAPNDVVWESRTLPVPLSGQAYYTGGTNLSDDLFIYNKKKFSGYRPSTLYFLSFEMNRHDYRRHS